MKLKFLITGAKGQLATEFIKYFQENSVDYVALSKEELNISDLDAVYEVLRNIRPGVVINCAAYNLVDKAEKEPEKAYLTNAIGPNNLAIASKEIGAKLVHYSTDYVFDGTKEGPYTEEDFPNPLSEYAKSKYLGEVLLSKVLDNYLIFRTSWVYGEGKQNFLYKLEQWAKEREFVKVAVDEFSVPTSTRTIVEITLKAIQKGLTGLYHLVNSGYASRYEWAKEYFRLKGIKKLILPAYQEDFNLPAKRPKWSVMSNEKISRELNIEIKDWREELKNLV
ncbi:MAG: dTDP-4-dehydrorhamnose reductase [Thermosulfidibacteraceae bacterium]